MVIHSDSNNSYGSFYVGASTEPPTQVILTSGATNYIELELETEPGTSDLRVFWDPSESIEFTNEVNTVTYLKHNITVNTVGWSGSPKLKLAQIVVDGGGVITSLLDKRELFFRLAGSDPYTPQNMYPWHSTGEPDPDRKLDANAFIGADKNIPDFKTWMNAVMTEIYKIKFGLTPPSNKYWFTPTTTSLYELGKNPIMYSTGTFNWNQTAGVITATQDLLTMFPGSSNINTIQIAEWASVAALTSDKELYYVDLDPESTTNINLVKTTISAYTDQDNRHIIATRVGNDVIISCLSCDLLKLSDGETSQLRSELTQQVLDFIGADNAADSDPDYSGKGVANKSLNNENYNAISGESLTARLAKTSGMIADLKQDQMTKIIYNTYSTLSANIEFNGTQVRWEGLKLLSSGDAISSTINDQLVFQNISDGGGFIAEIDRDGTGAITLIYESDLATNFKHDSIDFQHKYIVMRREGNNLYI